MKKISYNRKKFIHQKITKKDYFQSREIDPKRVVDINKLLNRVKINKKIEIKKKVIFFSSIVLIIGFVGTFINIIK
tara:strand:- start:491 stop:718 length:228 start_codon:yes stop_codon:yes gene_type:complete